MRILFLTNFYLPHGLGGEEQSCLQVVEGMKQRGHATLVLTSMHGTHNVPAEAGGVYRSLYLEMDLVPWRHSLTFFTERKARERRNLQRFRRVLEQFEPDLVFIWGMWNLPRSLPAFAEAWDRDRVIYRFATYWPTLPSQHEFYWRTPGRKWYSRLPKRMLGQLALSLLERDAHLPPLTFRHALCVSAATRDRLVEAGIPVANARIIHTGLDVSHYVDGDPQRQRHDHRSLNLLYAGRLAPDKGIDTAIQATAKLVFGQGLQGLRLSLAGSGSPEYEAHLRRLVNQTGLADYVSFLGRVPPQEMPQLLQRFDVLLVPSIWAEPFARVILEGMISGLVVVATSTGGTPEVILNGENGLLFTPGDPEDLAQKVARVAEEPQSRRKLAEAAQRTVRQRFTLTKMMDEIEGFLQDVAGISSHERVGHFA